jgi:hypothetical protein
MIELKSFSRANWWVYIIYLLILTAISYNNKEELLPTFVVSTLHFIADIFIMMMFSSYLKQLYREGTLFQIISLLIFLSIKIYTGLTGGGWQYLLADPIYMLAAIKSYNLDVNGKPLKMVNAISMTVLSTLLILAIAKHPWFGNFVPTTQAAWIQTIGIFTFAISLCSPNNGKLRYLLSLLGLALMVTGSTFEIVYSWQSGHFTGLSISYMLLPLSVLIFYLKKWNSMFGLPTQKVKAQTEYV